MISPLAQSLAVLAATWICWRLLRKLFSRSPLDNIRGPPRASLWSGNLRQISNVNAWQFHDEMAEFGGVSKFWGMLGAQQLYVYDPRSLYSILVKDADVYPKHADSELSVMIIGRGLLGTHGEQHKRQRKLMNPVFSTSHMKLMISHFYSTCHRLSDVLATQLLGEEEKEIDILLWMSRTALELIGQAGLGYSFDPLTEETDEPFVGALKAIVPAFFAVRNYLSLVPHVARLGSPAFFRRILPYVPSRRVQRLRQISDTMYESCRAVYEQKKQALLAGDEDVAQQVGRGKDIMAILLKANLAAAEEERLPESEVIAQMSTLVFAATDTTTNALSRIICLLAEKPDVQAKLRAEIVHARAGRDEDLSYEELDSLQYLDAISRETLRLYPPVPRLQRCANKDMVLPLHTPITGVDGTQLDSITVPRGTNIVLSLRSLNRCKLYWGEDALEWKPERWMNPLPAELIDAHVPGIYSNVMTFSGGPYSCIGFKFSQLEMKVVLALLIERFSFSLADKEIRWNMAGIQFPTVADSKRPSMPLRMRLVQNI